MEKARTPLQAHWNGKCSRYQITFIWLGESSEAHASLRCSCTCHISHIRQQHRRQLTLKPWVSLIATTRLGSHGALRHGGIRRVCLYREKKMTCSSWQLCPAFSQGAVGHHGSLVVLNYIQYTEWCTSTTQASCQLKPQHKKIAEREGVSIISCFLSLRFFSSGSL